MAPLTPESSPRGSSKEVSPMRAHVASAIPIPRLIRSTHTCNSKLFCCDQLYPLTRPLGPHEKAIYHFVYYMVNPPSPFSTFSPSPLSHTQILSQTPYIIRYQHWTPAHGGQLTSTRHFTPHPHQTTSFIELSASALAASSRNAKWVPNWRYMKFKCDVHEGPWFTCYVLERRETGNKIGGEVMPLQVRVKRKREVGIEIKGDVGAEEVIDEVLGKEEEDTSYTPTRKIAKRRKL
ncbi:hypothetical protein VTL71DRAFT_5875 [Oculimacula yallundae]|uniref:Uncharacterized protein n=1 Tax=Oculimacula yallundae TaxID=86028 RepID=A0ABR4BYS6_9HELO